MQGRGNFKKTEEEEEKEKEEEEEEERELFAQGRLAPRGGGLDNDQEIDSDETREGSWRQCGRKKNGSEQQTVSNKYSEYSSKMAWASDAVSVFSMRRIMDENMFMGRCEPQVVCHNMGSQIRVPGAGQGSNKRGKGKATNIVGEGLCPLQELWTCHQVGGWEGLWRKGGGQ